MPKVTKNKKRIDPRYFLYETAEHDSIKEAVVEPGFVKAGQWPGVSPQDRVSKLAHDAMNRQASGEIPPWESTEEENKTYPAPSGNSVTDEDVIRSIYNLLMDGASPGHRVMAPRFMEMMKERGVISQEAGDKINKGHKIRAANLTGASPDVDADDMEDSLGRFKDMGWEKK